MALGLPTAGSGGGAGTGPGGGSGGGGTGPGPTGPQNPPPPTPPNIADVLDHATLLVRTVQLLLADNRASFAARAEFGDVLHSALFLRRALDDSVAAEKRLRSACAVVGDAAAATVEPSVPRADECLMPGCGAAAATAVTESERAARVASLAGVNLGRASGLTAPSVASGVGGSAPGVRHPSARDVHFSLPPIPAVPGFDNGTDKPPPTMPPGVPPPPPTGPGGGAPPPLVDATRT